MIGKLLEIYLIIQSYWKARDNMTESEAAEKLEAHIECESKRSKIEGCNDGCTDCELAYLQGTSKEHIESLKIAVHALEKQIPKKPNKAIDSSWGTKKEVYVCPVCDYYLTQVHFIAPQKIESNKEITYCETCGQAIDWSDENGSME